MNTSRVNEGQPSKDVRTSYTQQYALQLNRGNPNPDPRTQIIMDIITIIQEAQKLQEEVIVCKDTNQEI